MICSRYRSSTSSSSGEAGLDSIQAFYQLVDFAGRIVQVERGACAGGDAELLMDRHGAVVAGPHRDSIGVEQLGHVVGGHAVQRERRHSAALLGRWAVDADARYFLQALDGVSHQGLLVAVNGRRTD